MIKSARVLVFIFAWLAWPSVAAQANATLSVFGVADFSSFNYSVPIANVSNTSKLGVGAGAQIETELYSRSKAMSLGLEVGAVYLRRQFYVSDPAVPIHYNLTAPGVQFPVQLKARFLSLFTVGFGAYYTMPIGDLKVIDSSDEATIANGSYSYAAVGLKKADYGVIGSFGLIIPLGLFDVIAETRFAMGAVDLNDPAITGLTTKTQTIQAVAGVRFGRN